MNKDRFQSSTYKTKDMSTQKKLELNSNDPTTEKKKNTDKAILKQRPFYCSHDTEKAPGHSFSTAEEDHRKSNKENEYKLKLNGSFGMDFKFLQPSKQ